MRDGSWKLLDALFDVWGLSYCRPYDILNYVLAIGEATLGCWVQFWASQCKGHTDIYRGFLCFSFFFRNEFWLTDYMKEDRKN